ncbi:MAG: cyclopropane-fatty-acyl-phospholipid synthase family protein, partial [Pseudomonadota bacterium]
MRLLSRLLTRLVQCGRLTIVDHDGTRRVFGDGGDGPDVHLRFTTPGTAGRIGRSPVLGAGEAWMDGELLVERGGGIGDLLELVALNARWSDDNPMRVKMWRTQALASKVYQLNYRRRAKDNVAHHYDLSDRLYDLFLDADRQYSCAYFRGREADIEQAQHDKKAHIAAKLYLQPGQHVLDIGCGWGGMALYLAKVADVRVTGITLSEEQLKVARQRAEEEGLADRVRFELIDYRDISGPFDRIVSVGMFEHVGLPHYREFF